MKKQSKKVIINTPSGGLSHIPRGEMCLTCTYLHRKCNHLPFTEMKVIHIFKEDGLKEVKCTDFERGEDSK